VKASEESTSMEAQKVLKPAEKKLDEKNEDEGMKAPVPATGETVPAADPLVNLHGNQPVDTKTTTVKPDQQRDTLKKEKKIKPGMVLGGKKDNAHKDRAGFPKTPKPQEAMRIIIKKPPAMRSSTGHKHDNQGSEDL
ncbi:hypothetical protein KKF84_04005, partial [Myxococcota bacterium]|nr:hypothetical protein [Myxococcota bacterium]